MSRDRFTATSKGDTSSSGEGEADRVLVGVFGAPHGVRGELRLKSFTTDPVAVGDYGPVQTPDGRTFKLHVVRHLKDDLVIVRVDNVADRDVAAKLTNHKLFIPRDRLPPPDDDEFYLSDLVGLPVFGTDDVMMGTIKAVVDFGAGDLLDIVPADNSANVLLPFTKAFVPGIDIPGRRVVIDPPLGLFIALPDDGEEQDGK